MNFFKADSNYWFCLFFKYQNGKKRGGGEVNTSERIVDYILDGPLTSFLDLN